MANLIGMVCGILLLRSISDSFLYTWFWYIFLTVIHVVANYEAVTCLCVKSLNVARLRIVFDEFYRTKQVLKPLQVPRPYVAKKSVVIQLTRVESVGRQERESYHGITPLGGNGVARE